MAKGMLAVPMPGCVLFAGLANGRVVAIDCDTWELLHSWQAHNSPAVKGVRVMPCPQRP